MHGLGVRASSHSIKSYLDSNGGSGGVGSGNNKVVLHESKESVTFGACAASVKLAQQQLKVRDGIIRELCCFNCYSCMLLISLANWVVAEWIFPVGLQLTGTSQGGCILRVL